VIEFSENIIRIQGMFTKQLKFRSARQKHLVDKFMCELYNIKYDYKRSKREDVIDRLAKIEAIERPFINRFIAMWIERCKLKHSLVFLQFRRHLPDAPLEEILELFEERKEYFTSLFNAIAGL
jgi:hypothetical protein